MMLPMTSPLERSSKERLISSMPKITPASGVLNAAAMPAEAPARISPGCRAGDSRPSANIIEAPTCTVGPSRPIEAPTSRPASVSPIFPTPMRKRHQLARAPPAPQLACGDRLRNAAAFGIGEQPPSGPGESSETERRHQRRSERPSVQAVEACCARAGADRHDDAGQADHTTAEQEDQPLAPAQHLQPGHPRAMGPVPPGGCRECRRVRRPVRGLIHIWGSACFRRWFPADQS